MIDVLILVLVLFTAVIVLIYNSFISLKNRVENSWAQVNVQLKKRSDLIPKLVEVVKGYSKYEKSTLTEITRLRTSIDNSRSISKKYELNNEISSIVRSFMAIAESYPALKANENFLELQKEIADVEDKIAFTRQFYNDTVYKFNTKLQSFPYSLIGSLMGLKRAESFSEKADYEGVNF